MGYALQIDTRQKIGKHDAKDGFFASFPDLKTVRTKLVVGDYMLVGGTISVDTKQDILELAQDIDREHDRFREECKLAKDLGIKLVVLVENKDSIKTCHGDTIFSLCRWQNPRRFINAKQGKRPPIDGIRLQKACLTMEQKYGVCFEFCAPDAAGARVLELLGVPVHE